jgi:transaldolase/glucose-6-phosphate isomerase
MNPVKALQQHGQAVWLDFLARSFIANGGLKTLVERDGVRGVTSNPSIFEKAIGETDEYDDSIKQALHDADRSVGALFESLAIEDIRHAADVLRPVYDETGGDDGFVSLEVSPYLANDTAGTIAEARRLWQAVERKNLMIKVPATEAGLPAIRALIADGINVNITLLFSQDVYEQVVEAYLSGLEALVGKGGDPSHVASVASFFVSRIDTAVDKQLDDKIAKANDPDERKRLAGLKGKIAIANARLAYRRYKGLFAGDRWNKLKAKGAKPQRLLWASTGTKNKAYSDVLYIEELIGPNTINTVPPATLDAFRDHGKLRDTLEEGVDAAQRALDDLARAGISLDTITRVDLVKEGVRLFAEAADKLFAAVAEKRAKLLAGEIDTQAVSLGAALDKTAKEATAAWRTDGTIRRLWQRDAAVWTGADEAKWLGWLDCVSQGLQKIGTYTAFAQEVKREGFTDALLLGMGGSSLGPEVLATTFGHKPGWPRLRILDSTDPAQVRAAEDAITLDKTLFIVSSKSGSTTEPNVLLAYFFHRLAERAGRDKAGRHFVAITDPGSSLEKTAKTDGFRRVFHGEPSIGGRYSVLSPFGLVPAAVAGVDVEKLLTAAETMVRSCGPDVPPDANPGVTLGIALGVAGNAGRDKITLLSSPKLADFGAWAEQLLAESTGKLGKGLIPVDGEPLGKPEVYGRDRFFIDLRTNGETDKDRDATLDALEKAGHPIARIVAHSTEHIGQEFFRFEIATAVAGAILGINPFDQPDVEASKVKTRELTAAFETSGALPPEKPATTADGIAFYADAANVTALRQAGADGTIESWLKAHLSRLQDGDFAAVLAYVARNAPHEDQLQKMRCAVRDRRHVATCVGFGPRFLHSTGQAYKGGPNSGVFLQITADTGEDLPVPGHRASFGVIESAQARGDFDVLSERKRRALRAHITGDVASGLAKLTAAVMRALN